MLEMASYDLFNSVHMCVPCWRQQHLDAHDAALPATTMHEGLCEGLEDAFGTRNVLQAMSKGQTTVFI